MLLVEVAPSSENYVLSKIPTTQISEEEIIGSLHELEFVLVEEATIAEYRNNELLFVYSSPDFTRK